MAESVEHRSVLREIALVDRSRLSLTAALPSALGFGIPLVVGLIAGRTAEGCQRNAQARTVVE